MKNMASMVASTVARAEEEKLELWKVFREKLYDVFGDSSQKAIAQNKLLHIRQDGRSVEELNVEFTLLMIEAEMHESAGEILYKQALKPVIKSKIYESGTIPKNLQEWQERAKAIDLGWRESLVERRGTRNSGKLRVLLKKPEGFKRLPDEEFQRRRKEKACFKCGIKGHFSKECRVQARKMQEETMSETGEQDFP